MFFSTVASLIIFFTLFNFSFTNNFLGLGEISLRAPEAARGQILNIAEDVKNIMRSRNQLPANDNKPAGPVKLEGAENFELGSASGVIMDVESLKPLFEKNADESRPIASITKLMTAFVFLEYNPGWESIYQIKSGDKREGGKAYLFTGEKIKIKDLFYSSLVASDNVATAALVGSTGMKEEEFVQKMADKAQELGLNNTIFKDSIGLDNGNVSTAREVAKIAEIALANKDINEATLTKRYEFSTLEGRKKVIYNTDSLLDLFPQNGIKILGGKTGFTEAAGYCFAGKFIDHQNREVISVVLGNSGNDQRFRETHDLVNWAYKSYQW